MGDSSIACATPVIPNESLEHLGPKGDRDRPVVGQVHLHT